MAVSTVQAIRSERRLRRVARYASESSRFRARPARRASPRRRPCPPSGRRPARTGRRSRRCRPARRRATRPGSRATPVSPMMVSAIDSMHSALHPVDPLPHGRFVAQVGLEDQPERLALVVDEVEVGAHRSRDPLLVVARRRHRAADLVDERVTVRVQQCQIELQLAGKVLVQHRLGDACPLRDVVHRRGVIALRDKDFLRGGEQLLAACRARQADRPAGSLRTARRRHRHLRISRVSELVVFTS